ncbi:ribonuclease HIII [Candidatus Phytoplasma melaleucae]|uniref:Ribonuclease n=1 Tax=Candidatus Phytoplasma melaleucae TaxID=2982630 RepID=A0ABT9DDW5_9MOLU|nr:ribonuclease HIII ['Melaleuca sp.' phytoplasma]MDO8168211.1 ribonuclease HIII ['Melaleuca sp.' phytoplasma]MDV3205485.1 ribonuclease HIII [Weeping tea tree witches'-broom phytoplasma]
MTTYCTLKLNLCQIQKIKYSYKEFLVDNSFSDKIICLIKKNKITITCFYTGTCLLQGVNIQPEIENLQNLLNMSFNFHSARSFHNPQQNQNDNIGSDESGTGDVFGPITVCCAFVTAKNAIFLKQKKIQDSKKLSKKKIFETAPIIMEKIPYCCEILSPLDYNCLIKIHNIKKILALLHNRIILKLLKKINQKVPVVLDQFIAPVNYFHYLRNTEQVHREIIFQTQAESTYLSVAAASIIARYLFLREINKLGNLMNINLKLGATKQVNEQIFFIYSNKGVNILKKISKCNFKNVKDNYKIKF